MLAFSRVGRSCDRLPGVALTHDMLKFPSASAEADGVNRAMPQIAAYGLNAPTVADAYAAVARVHGTAAETVWPGIAARAGRPPSVIGVIAAMRSDGHPVIRLCGESLHIRQESYAHLANVQVYVR